MHIYYHSFNFGDWCNCETLYLYNYIIYTYYMSSLRCNKSTKISHIIKLNKCKIHSQLHYISNSILLMHLYMRAVIC